MLVFLGSQNHDKYHKQFSEDQSHKCVSFDNRIGSMDTSYTFRDDHLFVCEQSSQLPSKGRGCCLQGESF